MTNEPIKDPEFKPKWENRRKVIFLTLIFCAFCILYVMFKGDDTRVNETIITFSYLLAGTTIGSYVFGVVWQDINKS